MAAKPAEGIVEKMSQEPSVDPTGIDFERERNEAAWSNTRARREFVREKIPGAHELEVMLNVLAMYADDVYDDLSDIRAEVESLGETVHTSTGCQFSGCER